MNGPIVVRSGDELIIEEGALVKAFPGQAGSASFLLVEEGGKLIAEGSASSPIIFTSLADRIEPGQVIIPDENETFRLPVGALGLWGGLILLGDAPIVP